MYGILFPDPPPLLGSHSSQEHSVKCLSWSPCLLHLPSRTEPETDLAALLAEYSVKAERSSQRSLSLLSFRVLDQKEQPGVERHLERQAEGLPTALYVLERKESAKYIHS